MLRCASDSLCDEMPHGTARARKQQHAFPVRPRTSLLGGAGVAELARRGGETAGWIGGGNETACRATTEKETRVHTAEGTRRRGRYPVEGKKAAKMAAPARICCFIVDPSITVRV